MIETGFFLDTKYWMAPEQVRRPVVLEHFWRNRWGQISRSDRDELVSFKQAR